MMEKIRIFACVFQNPERKHPTPNFLYRFDLSFPVYSGGRPLLRFGLSSTSQNSRVCRQTAARGREVSNKTRIKPSRVLWAFLFCLVCFGCGELFDKEGERDLSEIFPAGKTEEPFDIFETEEFSPAAEMGKAPSESERSGAVRGFAGDKNPLPANAGPFSGEGESPSGEGVAGKKGVIFLMKDRELTEDTFIQGGKVILKGVMITTLHHSLRIRADEFVSRDSVIRNFPMGKTARRRKDGRGGGNILIEAKRAEGDLGLVLNGEKGGSVPKKSLSREKRLSLNGDGGDNGDDAVYGFLCKDIPSSKLFGLIPFPKKPLKVVNSYLPMTRSHDRRFCRDVCAAPPTAGKDGSAGLTGLAGFDGKKGGRSGSFHLRAFRVSDFRLTDIYNVPGAGSEGGAGGRGGLGGKAGRNGKDKKDLCAFRPPLPRPKKGPKGKRGPQGKKGADGEKGTVCVERIIPDYTTGDPEDYSKEVGETVCY